MKKPEPGDSHFRRPMSGVTRFAWRSRRRSFQRTGRITGLQRGRDHRTGAQQASKTPSIPPVWPHGFAGTRNAPDWRRRPALTGNAGGLTWGYNGTQIFSTVFAGRDLNEPPHCGGILPAAPPLVCVRAT